MGVGGDLALPVEHEAGADPALAESGRAVLEHGDDGEKRPGDSTP
jgi:hypothetical protein